MTIVYALLAAYLMFFIYSLKKNFSVKDLLKMSFEGAKTTKNILVVFVLIGMITASWRASGTIAYIIYSLSGLFNPMTMFLAIFLTNCIVSVLTGTAFGTVATVGMICITISNIMGINPLIAAGAIFSGIFFGDRCSPMSSGAILICDITHTDIYVNIKNMIKTSVLPFIITCILYIILGLGVNITTVDKSMFEIFSRAFVFHWSLFVPAGIIVIFSLFKIKVRPTLLSSIIVSCILTFILQGNNIAEILKILLLGYESTQNSLNGIIDGGGILSMANAGCIIVISCSLSGMFEGTSFFENYKNKILLLSKKTTPFIATVVVAIATGMLTFNQTLCSILTCQLCSKIYDDKEELAVNLENSSVLISPLFPWAISSAIPLATMNVSPACLIFAFYLYLVPIHNILTSLKSKSASAHNSQFRLKKQRHIFRI